MRCDPSSTVSRSSKSRSACTVNLRDFDALTEVEQQVMARRTTDPVLMDHIVWSGNTSCWPFLAANAQPTPPELLEAFTDIVTAHDPRASIARSRITGRIGRVTTTSPVRFGNSTELNAVLRSALAQVSNYRCFLCSEPRDFADLEIDHLIARTTTPTELDEVRASLGFLPAGFDLNSPENLAVICGPCNSKKSSKRTYILPAIQLELMEAIARAEKVVERFRLMKEGRGFSATLARAAAADLQDAKTREAFLEFAPGLVQRLATLDESRVDFLTSQLIEGRNTTDRFDLRLIHNNRLRFLRDVTSLLLAHDLADVIRSLADELLDEVLEEVVKVLSDGPHDAYSCALTVGSVDILHFELQVIDGVATRDGNLLRYEVSCVVDGWVNAHVTGYDPTASASFRDSQTDVWLGGAVDVRFEIALSSTVATAEGVVLNLGGLDLAPDWGTDRY